MITLTLGDVELTYKQYDGPKIDLPKISESINLTASDFNLKILRAIRVTFMLRMKSKGKRPRFVMVMRRLEP